MTIQFPSGPPLKVIVQSGPEWPSSDLARSAEGAQLPPWEVDLDAASIRLAVTRSTTFPEGSVIEVSDFDPFPRACGLPVTLADVEVTTNLPARQFDFSRAVTFTDRSLRIAVAPPGRSARWRRGQVLELSLSFTRCSQSIRQSLTPHPEENLQSYKARMEAYFEPLIGQRGLANVIADEGGEYNEYARFLHLWEPRLFPHGDFSVHFDLQETFYSRRERSADGPRGVVLFDEDDESSEWREIGPRAKPHTTVGAEGTGPIKFITFFESAPSHMLSGSTAGGLFYSTDGGLTWSSTGTDTEIGTSGVSTATFHPTDYQTWFAASSGNVKSTGAGWIGRIGGVFRTTDEGGTWTQIGTQAQLGGIWSEIFKIAINPQNPDQLWAATSAGLFATDDALGGNPTWKAVLTGAYVYDFEFRPTDPNWLYATAADRDPITKGLINWRYLYSSDGGATWKKVPHQPPNTCGASGLTIEVSAAKVDNLYALTTFPGGTSDLFIVDLGSEVWKLVTGSAYITMGGGHSFGVDPYDPGEIFLSQGTEGRRYNYLGNPAYIQYSSTYGKKNSYHPDIEDLVAHPLAADEVWMAHHGGVAVSFDNGQTWQDRSTGLGAAQPLRMAASSDAGYVAVGLNHTGTIITIPPWSPQWLPAWRQFQGAFCDGLRPLIDPTTPQHMWHSCQWGEWKQSTNTGNTFITNGPYSPSWIAEAVFNKPSPETQYRISTAGGFHTVKRTMDRGNSWADIGDFKALYPTATTEFIIYKLYTPETEGNYLLAHVLARTIGAPWWTDNRLYRTTLPNDPNANAVIASWEELPLPDNRWLSDIEFDPADPNRVYIAYASSSANSNDPIGTGMVYLLDYTNPADHTYGVCSPGVCSDLTLNLPNATAGQDILAIERNTKGALYYATDFGVFTSTRATRASGGKGWSLFGRNLPHTSYSGLQINDRTNVIRAASSGRGVWEHDLPPRCSQLPPQLALWLPFDEGSGTTAHNTSRFHVDGTHVGGPIPTSPGKVDKALCFDGQDDHVDVPTYGAVTLGTGDFTIEAWLLLEPGASGVRVLLDKRNQVSFGDLRGYSFFLYNGRPGLQLADGTYSNYLAQATVPADGQFHHVAVTVDRSEADGLRFFLDGKPAGPPLDPTNHAGSLSNAAPVRIGELSPQVIPGGGSALHGCLDEVSVFRRALPPETIEAIRRSGEYGKCKLSCQLPQDSRFCGQDQTLTVGAQLCNHHHETKTLAYSFGGLPTGAGCPSPGPTGFALPAGTVTLPAGGCGSASTAITRPPWMLPFGVSSCFELSAEETTTREIIRCTAPLTSTEDCSDPPHDPIE